MSSIHLMMDMIHLRVFSFWGIGRSYEVWGTRNDQASGVYPDRH